MENSNLIFDDEEFLNNNRITGFKNIGCGDFTLILDTDMLILNHPNFDFAKKIYAKKTGIDQINFTLLSKICEEIGVDPNKVESINNGCILISNDIKNNIYNDIKKYKPIVQNIIKDNNGSLHFDDQILMGILLQKNNGGYFNDKINHFTNHKKPIDENDIEIVHYLGTYGLENPYIYNIINKY